MHEYTGKALPFDSDLLAPACVAAIEGAKAARSKQRTGLNPRRKSQDVDDLVTEGDEAAQNAILERLPRRLHDTETGRDEAITLLTEEKTDIAYEKSAQWRWVVDPIDGTLPYSRGEPHWCVSIALQKLTPAGIWESHAAALYQASARDSEGHCYGKLFIAQKGKGAFIYDHAKEPVSPVAITRPTTITPIAELSARDPFGAWARQELSKHGIATQFRRSICYAATEMLLGHQCAVIQDAGPLEWDVAAITLIAREAGVHLRTIYVDNVSGCARYAVLMAWDKALFDLFEARLPGTAKE